MKATIRQLCHYPVKGLSAQSLDQVTLTTGRGFPLDRAFGLARHDSGFDPADPRPLPKTRFVVLARDAALATLDTRYDAATRTLHVTRAGETTAFDITDAMARDVLAGLVADHVGLPADERPSLQSAEPHRFTDVSVVSPQMMHAVSLINLDSVAAFSGALGQDIDAARFRANILFDGMDPWAEFDLIGRTLQIGEVRLDVVQRTRRCPATEVNPETGARDADVPRALRMLYGHADMGVYAHVVQGGTMRPGDAVAVIT